MQPPITVHGIPGRYASALYTAAAKAGKLDEVQDELTEVRLPQLVVAAQVACNLCLLTEQ